MVIQKKTILKNKQSMNRLQLALENHTAVKVIAGIANFDLENVQCVLRAAETAGAHAVDVAATPEMVRMACEETTAVVFASSVEPAMLAAAVESGAHVAELGNFDALYDQGLFLNAADVLKLARETKALLSEQGLFSVTIPGHLGIDAQMHLAAELEALGVDFIQTEGSARVLISEPTVKSLNASEKEALTLRNTAALAANTSLPLITASGIHAGNVSLALQAGASMVGVGTFVREGVTEAGMQDRISAVMQALVGSAAAASAEYTPVAMVV